MDGKLAPTKSPALSEIWLSEKLICDIHLMYQNPSDFTEELIALKPNLVIIHAETHSSNDLPLMATQLRDAGIKFGLALLPQTIQLEISVFFRIADHRAFVKPKT
jgi:pentose-5-phosphate-3-epimerase